MTGSDRRNLAGGGIIMLLVTIATFILTSVNLEVISKILFTESIEITIAITVVTAILSAVVMIVSYSGGLDDHHSTNYYYIQPSMEEILFRFNSMIIVNTFHLKPEKIVILCLLQAFVFAVLHGSGFVKHLVCCRLLWGYRSSNGRTYCCKPNIPNQSSRLSWLV